MLESEFVDWLASAETPSIRYRALVDLVGLSKNNPRVVQAREAIMKDGPVPAILSRQSEAGNWMGERSYYTPKYTSTHWSLMLLAELGVDDHDARFQQGVQYMLETTADELSHQVKTHTRGMSCFWGNLLRYALHAGLYEDPRVGDIISYASMDLGDGPCLCRHNGGYACAWGVVRTLWGLAALPKEMRDREINQAIERGIKFLLESFDLVKTNYPSVNEGEPHPLWFRLNFPLFYQADILFTLRVLGELELLNQHGVKPALDWLENLRGRNGRWKGSSPYRQRTWRELGDREETDRWVSLHASRILRDAGRFPARGDKRVYSEKRI
jgi:hypothetical protein